MRAAAGALHDSKLVFIDVLSFKLIKKNHDISLVARFQRLLALILKFNASF